MTNVRCCQQNAHPPCSAASHENESYNTNSPSGSTLTLVRIIHIRLRVPRILAEATIIKISRAAFISLTAQSDRRLLFEGGIYSKKDGTY